MYKPTEREKELFHKIIRIKALQRLEKCGENILGWTDDQTGVPDPSFHLRLCIHDAWKDAIIMYRNGRAIDDEVNSFICDAAYRMIDNPAAKEYFESLAPYRKSVLATYIEIDKMEPVVL